MNTYKMTYKSAPGMEANSVIVNGVNAEAIRNKYHYFIIVALQAYNDTRDSVAKDIGFEMFSK